MRYAGSQPWPFPSSLMLGFFATAATTRDPRRRRGDRRRELVEPRRPRRGRADRRARVPGLGVDRPPPHRGLVRRPPPDPTFAVIKEFLPSVPINVRSTCDAEGRSSLITARVGWGRGQAMSSRPMASSMVRNFADGLGHLGGRDGAGHDAGAGVEAHGVRADLGTPERDHPLAVAVAVAPSDDAGVVVAVEAFELADRGTRGGRRHTAHGRRRVQRQRERPAKTSPGRQAGRPPRSPGATPRQSRRGGASARR